MIAPPKFSREDADRAHDEWGANCGPAALAAIAGLTLSEIRPHMIGFESKGYTNPTMMIDAVGRLGLNWRRGPVDAWPSFGLVRIQWEGPWTHPGVPIRARYRHTHWVAAGKSLTRGIGVFDVNAMGNGSGWCAAADWEASVVPWILESCVPRASGGWHRTHVLEIERAV